uniref:Uncharacterized protein n=1 Tax=Schizaphis graminum TaxID=13262 RepID=A0A2S2PQ49_SCHGA
MDNNFFFFILYISWGLLLFFPLPRTVFPPSHRRRPYVPYGNMSLLLTRLKRAGRLGPELQYIDPFRWVIERRRKTESRIVAADRGRVAGIAERGGETPPPPPPPTPRETPTMARAPCTRVYT